MNLCLGGIKGVQIKRRGGEDLARSVRDKNTRDRLGLKYEAWSSLIPGQGILFDEMHTTDEMILFRFQLVEIDTRSNRIVSIIHSIPDHRVLSLCLITLV